VGGKEYLVSDIFKDEGIKETKGICTAKSAGSSNERRVSWKNNRLNLFRLKFRGKGIKKEKRGKKKIKNWSAKNTSFT